MTVSPDARTPSASVHALSGSTPPGAARPVQPFGIATAPAAVAEMPDTFAPLGAAAADVVAGLAAQRATVAHPDAAVIDLAGRVQALAAREHALWGRWADVDDAVTKMMPRRPAGPSDVRPLFCKVETIDGVRTTTTVEEPGWREALREAEAAHAAAMAEHERLEAEIGARLGLPLLQKLAHRTTARLTRWGLQLAAMEPATQAGLAAKAAASVAVAEGDELPDGWRQALAISLGRDAVRLASPRSPRPELARLVADWRDADRVACAADDRREEIVEALVLPERPDALRFRAGTDESYIGRYQSCHQPYGYTDPKQIARLRSGVAAVHQPRADEIVAAFDAWTAACDAARQAAGLPEAEAAWTRTRKMEVALRRRIVATPAASAEDLRLKAEVAVWCYGTVVDLEGDIAEAARAGHCGDGEAAAAVLLDVVRLLEPDAVPAAMPAAAGPSSNLRPAPLPTGMLAGRYPAGAPRDVVETYRTFLEMELRFLNHEVYGQTEGRLHYWLDNPAGSMHGGGEPPASSRAAAVLGLLGLMPGAADAARSHAASAA